MWLSYKELVLLKVLCEYDQLNGLMLWQLVSGVEYDGAKYLGLIESRPYMNKLLSDLAAGGLIGKSVTRQGKTADYTITLAGRAAFNRQYDKLTLGL